jgi:catechol 2,3-dioxygenase
MGSEPLDIDDLLNEIRGEKGSLEGMPAGTIIGHIHLRVASIPEAERFYCDVLGFELMQRYGPSAGFVSAGGYHHHIGYNTWESDGAPPPPPDAIGLRFFSVLLPDEGALRKAVSRIRQAGWPQEERPEGVLLHDPSGNTLLLENSG